MKETAITIEFVTEVSVEIADAIKRLAKTIGHNYKPLTDKDLSDMIASPNIHILLARGEKGDIAGMITVLVYRIPYVKKAYLDDLVVDEAYRSLGIGKKLMEEAVALARTEGASYVDLTARPRREAGNSLYEKIGFQKRETNVYRLVFDYAEV